MPEKPSSSIKRLSSLSHFAQNLCANHNITGNSDASEEKPKVKPTGGLFGRMKAQGLTKKIPVSHSKIDSDDNELKKTAEKRMEFVSKIKPPVKNESVQVTPKPKGIKRYFPSDEVKRPVVTETGSLAFRNSDDSPMTARNLFGVKRKDK